jgi:hypothetical protein
MFAFCFCFSYSLLTYTFCASPNNSSMDLFFQFSSFCNFEQKSEGLRVEGEWRWRDGCLEGRAGASFGA